MSSRPTHSQPRNPPQQQVVKAKVNAYRLNWNTATNVHHYDVVVTPQWTSKSEIKIGRQTATEVFHRLQTSVAPHIFTIHGVYDGKANLFSHHSYALGSSNSMAFLVPFLDGSSRKEVEIKVTYAATVNMGGLIHLLRPTQEIRGNYRLISQTAIAVTMLNMFVQAQPRRRTSIFKATSFFFAAQNQGNVNIEPFQVWSGLSQSVRLSQSDGIIVNIDTTLAPVLPETSLTELAKKILSGDSRRSRVPISLQNLTRPDVLKLRTALRGVKVKVVIGGKTRRPRAIKDIIPSVGAREFQLKNGETLTVAQHFRKTHNDMRIQDSDTGVALGNELFPMSVCHAVEQLYKAKVSPQIVKGLMSAFPSSPNARLRTIEQGWRHLEHNNSPFLTGAGVVIDKEPLDVNGRLLTPPKIRFNSDNEHQMSNLENTRGIWDVQNRMFGVPGILEHLYIANLTGYPSSAVQPFVNEFTKSMQRRGMAEPAIHFGDHHGHGEWKRAVTQTRHAAVLVLLPNQAEELYVDVKHWGDVVRGIPTQCVRWNGNKHEFQGGRRPNGLDQYINNVLLKLNQRVGGINFGPKSATMSKVKEAPTMIVGMDVSHPGAGSQMPSIASIVASTEPSCTRYAARVSVQSSRTEVIADLQRMLSDLVLLFANTNGVLPQRYFFYRDGVSEGEFETIALKELPDIKNALKSIYAPKNTPAPAIIFIIVGKRHRFRFFSDQQRDTDRTGNLKSGFVVDQGIVHPVFHDFYLQSQPGLKGTSIPSHYTVIENSSRMHLQDLEQLSYDLCHCYTRATRAVKIPAPVYYADIACSRAKFHWAEGFNGDAASTTSAQSTDVEFYKKQFQPAHPDMINTMYFV